MTFHYLKVIIINLFILIIKYTEMNNFNISKLLTIDNTGFPKPPDIKQIQDKDVMLLYTRDRTPDKMQYIREAGVIYYLADPHSPAKQQGLSYSEALKMAIENYNLPKDYRPDSLVKRLIDKYYYSCIGEAGIALEALQKSIHLISLAAVRVNEFLNNKLSGDLSNEDISQLLDNINSVTKQIQSIPSLTMALKQAYENVRDEKEQQIGRGGQEIISSMNADEE